MLNGIRKRINNEFINLYIFITFLIGIIVEMLGILKLFKLF